MPSFAAPTNLLPSIATRSSSFPRRKFSSTLSTSSVTPRATTITTTIQCNNNSKNPLNPSLPSPQNPNNKLSKQHILKTLKRPLAIASAAGVALFLSLSPVGDGGSGGAGGDDGFGRGSGDNGGFWRKFVGMVLEIPDEDNESQDWDVHALPANIAVQLSKLSGYEKYKLSEILFFDRQRGTTMGTEDSFFETVSLRPGGVYTKTQLLKELETLATCGMFEKVDMEPKKKPDGTLGLTISFLESTWQSAERIRCINLGMMQQWKPIDMDADMTDKEKLEYYKNQEKDYKRIIDKARPCLLPASVHTEISQMLQDHGKVSARLLQKIRDRVQKWYHDEGYACAQVVNFGNLNTREVVCEVVEGDITQLVVQFQDKLGNVVEGNTQLALIKRELPKQLRQGNAFNIEAGIQALRNINSLALFSAIEVNPRPDEKNEGGIIVEIKLTELDQKSAEVSADRSLVPELGGRPTSALEHNIFQSRVSDANQRGIMEYEGMEYGISSPIVGSEDVEDALEVGEGAPLNDGEKITETRDKSGQMEDDAHVSKLVDVRDVIAESDPTTDV